MKNYTENYLIVAPHGYEELNTICENESNDLLLWLENERAREPFKSRIPDYELVFCEKDEYEDCDLNEFCRMLVDRVVDGFLKTSTVFLVVPSDILTTFFEQMRHVREKGIARMEVPKFKTIIEKYEVYHSFVPANVFAVRFHLKGLEWAASLGQYYKPEPPVPKKEEVIDETAQCESIYLVLLSGDHSQLDTLESKMLERLLDKALDNRSFELVDPILHAHDKCKQKT